MASHLRALSLPVFRNNLSCRLFGSRSAIFGNGYVFGSKIVTGNAIVPQGVMSYHNRALIGNRDVVGYGVNGTYAYKDRWDFPFPSIRWKENSPEIMALREKEKGDWRKMTVEEKKQLYRASFCLTFAELNAPTGEWKGILGISLLMVTIGLFLFAFTKIYVLPDLPETMTDEKRRRAQLKRMIILRVNPITGISSKWDYENDTWKK